MRRLIVNADDYGLSPCVDAGIRACAARGVVTSVSVLIERVERDHLRALRDAAPHVGIGLHVDVTADLSRPQQGGVTQRVRDQYARFVDLVGRPPTHVDTHKHRHRADPAVFDAVAGLGVPVRANHTRMRRELRRRGVPCTDGFVGDVSPRPYWTARRLRATLASLPRGVTELMCHPATRDDLPPPLWYGAQRVHELATFLSPHLRDRIRARGVELVSYGDLRGVRR